MNFDSQAIQKEENRPPIDFHSHHLINCLFKGFDWPS